LSDPIWATDLEFRDRYAGHRGIIIGRGLYGYQRNTDLDKFTGVKIGCNHAYRVTSLDALVWMDPKFFEANWREISRVDCHKFAINPIHYSYHGVTIYGLEAIRPEKCALFLRDGFYPCNLSGYIALNLALIFGLNPVWLYGFSPNTDVLQKRSESFKLIGDWVKDNNREVYITDKGSYLTKFFPYQVLPVK